MARRSADAAVARGDGRRAGARARAGRARVGPVRRARRQDHPPGGADAQPGRARRRREAPRPRGGAAQDRRAHGRDDRRRPHRRRDAAFGETFDRVLVDPPCSDLGTLASRPDARWRKAGRPEALAALQREILESGAAAVAPGGTLVYSTCTISPIENERVVAAPPGRSREFLRDRSGRRRAALEDSDHRRSTCTDGSLTATTSKTCNDAPGRWPARAGRWRARSSRTGCAAGCREPWLRPTPASRPLPLRELPAPLRTPFGVPQLWGAFDHRAHVQHCAVHVRSLPSSMLAPI